MRRCDTLMLVNDLCPAGYLADERHPERLCQTPAVQISLMAAAPGHLFFKCALALLLRNVHRRVVGRSTLDTTGPVVAGACLQRFHADPYFTNYSLQMTLGVHRMQSPAADLVRIFRVDHRRIRSSSAIASAGSAPSSLTRRGMVDVTAKHTWTPVVHVHAWKAATTKQSGYVDYLQAWRAARIFTNTSEGCTLNADNSSRRWVPGTATRLGRFWHMVQ